jgi:DNA polymerase III subunit delta'
MTAANGFSAIIGQQHPIRLLKTLLRNETLPHAMLFTGDDGVGKKMTASAFAMACNCLTLKSELPRRPHLDAIDACGVCAPCRKISGNHHADIIHIAPHSSVIKIDRIRGLLQTLMLKPHEAERRVVILSDAQAMNPEAGNALLKVLEEPPERTLMILTARQESDLLPTVASRCRHIRFPPLGTAAIKKLLTATGDVEAESAETVATLCGGSYTRARRWLDNRWLRRRDWIIDVLSAWMTGNGQSDIRRWLAFSEMLVRKKDHIEESLEIVTMWLRDQLVVQSAPAHVLNQDRLDTLSTAAVHVNRRQLLEQIDAVDCAMTALRSNANARLTMDAMVLRMAGTRK